MSDLVVQVSGGQTREPSRVFAAGAAVGPLGVGSGGEWAVDGPGVGQVHTYLYFDGQSLMVATVPPNVTFLNGATIGADWTPVSAPCEVTLGGVRLFVQATGMTTAAPSVPAPAPSAEMDEEAATGYFAPQMGGEMPTVPISSMPHLQRPGAPMGRRPPPSEEATGYRPIEQMRADASGPNPALNPNQLGMLPAAGTPASGPLGPTNPGGPGGPGLPYGAGGPGAPYTSSGPTNPGGPVPGMPMSQFAPQSALPETVQKPLGPRPPGWDAPPGSAPAGDKANFWTSAPLPRKILYVLGPIAIVASGAMLLTPDAPPEKTTKAPKVKPGPSASNSAAPEASTSVPMMPAIGAGAIQPPGPLLPAAPRPSASAPKRPVYGVPKPAPPSLELQAVNAVSAGNYAEAISLYEKLSQQYPEVPAYKEAVRVLKAKSK